MIRLTKQERNSVYIYAKQFYEINGIYKTGMCFACIQSLKDNLGITVTKQNFSDLYEYLPEMLMVKPNNRRDHFWWEVNQIQRRLNAFDKMIKLTS